MDAVISLFDLTGAMVEPWKTAGYQTFIFDIQHPAEPLLDQLENQENPVKISGDYSEWSEIIDQISKLYNIKILFGFPPCTDLAVSGAKHFAKKLEADPLYRQKAMDMVYACKDIANTYDIPYMIENPVSVISSEWRKPDYIFHPYEYGGYLPKGYKSPYDIMPEQDAYTKKTCLWTNGFNMPDKLEVDLPKDYTYSPHFLKLGGKSIRTKNIRSATPRGFALAVYQANA